MFSMPNNELDGEQDGLIQTGNILKPFQTGFEQVGGLEMYYELYNAHPDSESGPPLVLIHGGGSTIDSSFGRILPRLTSNRRVVAMELQAHGRTADREQPLSFEQDGSDVVALLSALGIVKADILGFSNGGQTALQIALSYPEMVDRLVLASTFYKRTAAPAQFWEGFDHATLESMPSALKAAFLKVNRDPAALQRMFDRDVSRMKGFTGWTDAQVRTVTVKTLIVQGNIDVGSLDHCLEMHRQLVNSELVILPGTHGEYMGTLESLPEGQWTMPYFADILERFLRRR